MPALFIGTALTLASVFVLGAFRDPYVDFLSRHIGEDAAAIGLFPPIIASVLPLLCTLTSADRRLRSYRLLCPGCSADLTESPDKVLATRRCGACGMKVVAGPRTHSDEVYHRYSRIVQRRIVARWLWCWPIMAAVILTHHHLDETAFRNCPKMLFAPALLGTTAAGWAFLRTFDRLFLPQTVLSLSTLILGGINYWTFH